MKFTVVITDSAMKDLERAYLWLADQSEQHAPEWYNGAIDSMFPLEQKSGTLPVSSGIGPFASRAA